MITRERLEELIKQSGTIWYDGHFEIKLNPKQFSIAEQFGTTVLWYQKEDEPSDEWSWELEVLREDVDRAEWEYKMTAERTERFEPPMWEDIEDKYEFYFTCQDYKSKSSNPCGMFVVNKKGTLKNYILVRNVSHYPNIFTFDEPATKENYIKACEIVRDLFNKGGAK